MGIYKYTYLQWKDTWFKILYGRISSFTFSNRIFSSFYFLHKHLKESLKSKRYQLTNSGRSQKNYMQAIKRIKSASLLMLTIKILSMELYEYKNKHQQQKLTFSLLFNSASHTANSWPFFLESP
jgi:hypothetical protein